MDRHIDEIISGSEVLLGTPAEEIIVTADELTSVYDKGCKNA